MDQRRGLSPVQKLQAQREAFPPLVGALVRGGAAKREALRDGFKKAMATFTEQETWVDAPARAEREREGPNGNETTPI